MIFRKTIESWQPVQNLGYFGLIFLFFGVGTSFAQDSPVLQPLKSQSKQTSQQVTETDLANAIEDLNVELSETTNRLEEARGGTLRRSRLGQRRDRSAANRRLRREPRLPRGRHPRSRRPRGLRRRGRPAPPIGRRTAPLPQRLLRHLQQKLARVSPHPIATTTQLSVHGREESLRPRSGSAK